MKRFRLAIIRLAEKPPGGRTAGVIVSQMVDLGTSAAANYRAAYRARSPADFVSRMGIVAAELDQPLRWLVDSLGGRFHSRLDVAPFLPEDHELLAIAVSSIRTTKSRS
jgi:four helix bundle protein